MSQHLWQRSQWIQIAFLGLLTVACSTTSHKALNAGPAGIDDPTFRLEPAYIVSVNVPSEAVQKVMRGITDAVALEYGKYDQVAFRSATGVEQFRPLKGARAGEQTQISEMPTTRITFAIPEDVDLLRKVVVAARYAHPYEEPVIHVESGWMSKVKPGSEESNPNKWWNQPQTPQPNEPVAPATVPKP